MTGSRSVWSSLLLTTAAVAAVGCAGGPAAPPVAPPGPRALFGVVDTIVSAPTGLPYGAAAARGIAYITLHGPVSALSIWDFRTRTYRHAAIPTGVAPTNVAFSPDGRTAFVASQLSYRVERVNVGAARIDAKWHTPANDPFQVAVSPAGDRAYATGNAGWVYAFDTESGASRGAVQVEGAPNSVIITPDGRRAFMTHLRSRNIGVVDLERFTYASFAPMDDAEGQGIALSQDGGTLFAVSERSRRLYAFDVATGRRIASTGIEGSPFGLARTPDGRELWVTTLQGRLLRISTADLSQIGAVELGGRLRRIAMDPDGRGAVIADEQGRVVVMR